VTSFDDAVWEAVPARALPERFAARRDWLLARVAPGERVLDLGAGDGHFAAALADAGCTVVALDPSAVAVERSAGRVALLPPSGEIGLDDSSMDVVWAGEVIEHVADTGAWMSEVRRVLRSGGRVLLSTPWHGRVKTAALALLAHERAFDPRGAHLRFYTPRALRELLDDFGFDDVRLSSLGGAPLLRSTLLAEAVRGRWLG
jgi:2-polyprenyl-3-methyl-5-hydroxy-6-metoxy-1,4-benzoquinol methylase